MTLKERKQIADGLWLAAEAVDESYGRGCCSALSHYGNLSSKYFFIDLFDCRMGDPEDDFVRCDSYWMAYTHEMIFGEEVNERRVLALLLAREIALSSN